MRYLQQHGYRAIPVNPFAAGVIINGERCYASLAEVPEKVDMVDVFRRSEAAGEAVDAAIATGARIVWMQLGVRDAAAARRSRSPASGSARPNADGSKARSVSYGPAASPPRALPLAAAILDSGSNRRRRRGRDPRHP